MARYISADELRTINQVVIQESGGSVGLREPTLLESTCFKPQTSYGGKDLYPDIFLKAAVFYEAVVNYHVFIDGNKRTGFAAMALFLHINGYEILVSDREIVDYTILVATNNPDLADIAIWIKKHSRKVNS